MVLADELEGAKQLTDIQLISMDKHTGTWNNFEWTICHTSLSALTNNFNTNYDGNTPVLVYSTPAHTFDVGANKWEKFPLDNAFVYDGTSNLVVETRYKGFSSSNNFMAGSWSSSKRSVEGGYSGQTGGSQNCTPMFRFSYGATGVKVSSSVNDGQILSSYPNPFRSSTGIHFVLSGNSDVRVGIYDMSGKLVSTILNGKKETGMHTVKWHGTDDTDVKVPAGIYFIRLDAENSRQVEKVVFMR